MVGQKYAFIIQVLCGCLVAGGLLCVSFFWEKSGYEKRQEATLTLARQKCVQELHIYEKARDLVLFRLRQAPQRRFEAIMEDLKNSSPLVETLRIGGKRDEQGLFLREQNIFEDVQPFNRHKALYTSLHMAPFLDSFWPESTVKVSAPQQSLRLSDKNFGSRLTLVAPSFSIWSYVRGHGFILFNWVLFVTLFVGVCNVRILRSVVSRAFWKQRRQLKAKVHDLTCETISREETFLEAQNLNALFEEAEIQKTALVSRIHERYQKMAMTMEAMHQVISKLLSQELESDMAERDAHLLLKNTQTLLGHMIKGFPSPSREEEIDLIPLWEKTWSIFMPKMMAKKIGVKITAPSKLLFVCDPLHVQIVLYNILNQLLDRFFKDHHITVVLKAGDPIQLSFKEDGFFMQKKYRSSSEKDCPSILQLPVESISGFARQVVWTLEWTGPRKGLNSTILTLPKPTEASPQILRMSDFKEKVS